MIYKPQRSEAINPYKIMEINLLIGIFFMKMKTLLGLAVVITTTSAVNAAPLPHTILVQDRAVVPVLKTEVTRTIAGQTPQRQVQATVLEVTNQGKNIQSHQIDLTDQTGQGGQVMPAPIVQKGSVIVPTSKIEVTSTLKEEGQAILQTKQVEAQGVEFKAGQEPAKRTLQLGQISNPSSKEAATRAIVTKNGVVTGDAVVIQDNP